MNWKGVLIRLPGGFLDQVCRWSGELSCSVPVLKWARVCDFNIIPFLIIDFESSFQNVNGKSELTFFSVPTVCQICAFGPFTLALIRTHFVKYVSVIFVLQMEV